MGKTINKYLSREIRKKREQLVAIRDEFDNLIDYLEIIEARAGDQKKPRLSHTEVIKRYCVK